MTLLNKNYDPQFSAGLWSDFKSDAAPLFIDGNNVKFDAGRVTPSPAQLLFAKVGSGEITALWSQLVFGIKTVFFQIGLDVFEFRAGVITKRFTALRSPVRFASFGNFTLLADGGVLAVKKLENGDFVRIVDGPISEFVAVYSPFVLSFGDRGFRWCSADDVDVWNPDPGNSARALPIRDMDGDIVSVEKAFNGFLVGSLKYQWQVSYIGAPLWFGVRQLTGIDVGAYSENAVCQANNMVYGFGPKGFWRLDGYSYQLLDRPQMKETIYKSFTDSSKLMLANDVANSRVLIIFDDNEGVRRSIVWDYQYNNFSRTSENFTCVDRGGAYDTLLFGDRAGKIFSNSVVPVPPIRNAGIGLKFEKTLKIHYGFGVGGFGNLGFGYDLKTFTAPVTSATSILVTVIRPGSTNQQRPGVSGIDNDVFLETRDMDFGTGFEKYFDVVVFKISQPDAGQFYFSFATKDRIQDEILWAPERLVFPDQPCYIRETKRYIRIKLRNVGAVERWQMNAIEYYGEVVGGRF